MIEPSKQTYKELLENLQNLTEDQLNCSVTIQCDDEFYPASLWFIVEDDVLDKDHPIISNH